MKRRAGVARPSRCLGRATPGAKKAPFRGAKGDNRKATLSDWLLGDERQAAGRLRQGAAAFEVQGLVAHRLEAVAQVGQDFLGFRQPRRGRVADEKQGVLVE